MRAGAALLAAALTVTVQGVRNGDGQIVLAVCEESAYPAGRCAFRITVPAAEGAVRVAVPDVPAGTYALRAYHDENGNGQLDRNLLGVPREGFGFGNDAPVLLAPPGFRDAAVTVGEDDVETALTLRYWISP
ncbi:uncharacterized protein (DUF2141 family) [Azospirillum brasilense]|uniref:Uncharacterized protein (DUF2141 family) n=1 Tax=Azospirillum brasilense TaxID=192 RepID=A0A560BVB9_AZOBR|nr:DUF2141 domain-containing protein [Azospirillum brasilense]MBK3735755.1 DUF2141 domain-containing protein [Azospirillum brasilense]TWA76565.1 uncharacterized protein (DUF2141 family) [Azospirillum brasilense]